MLCHEDIDHGLEQRNSLQEEIPIMSLEEVPIRCLVRDTEVASKLQMPFSVGPRWYIFLPWVLLCSRVTSLILISFEVVLDSGLEMIFAVRF